GPVPPGGPARRTSAAATLREVAMAITVETLRRAGASDELIIRVLEEEKAQVAEGNRLRCKKYRATRATRVLHVAAENPTKSTNATRVLHVASTTTEALKEVSKVEVGKDLFSSSGSPLSSVKCSSGGMRAGVAKAVPRPRGCRLPADWQPDAAAQEFALET